MNRVYPVVLSFFLYIILSLLCANQLVFSQSIRGLEQPKYDSNNRSARSSANLTAILGGYGYTFRTSQENLTGQEEWPVTELESLLEILESLPDEYKSLPQVVVKKGKKPKPSKWKEKAICLPLHITKKKELQRRFVEECTRLLDQRDKISESWEWRKISRWSGWDILGNSPENKNVNGFANPRGSQNPREDLVTSAGLFFVPLELPDQGTQPPAKQTIMGQLKCRLPSKYKFFKNHFVSHPDPQRLITCPKTYMDWIDPKEVEQVELLISSPSFASIASVAGHILLLIRRYDDVQGLSTCVGFVARAVDKKEGVMTV